jgi:enoyl-CoA hydratase/carnithine racemase
MSDAATPTVVLERTGAVATVRIDRPRALNALDEATLRDLARALRDVRREGDVRCLLVTGSGPKAFCAGADIAAMAEMSPSTPMPTRRSATRCSTAWPRSTSRWLPPSTARHWAAGSSWCSRVTSSWRASTPSWACPRPVSASSGIRRDAAAGAPGSGWREPRELIYLGRVIDAAEALRIGLVDRVVAADALLPEAKKLAGELAGRAPVALRAAKRLVGAAGRSDLASGLAREIDAFSATFASEDRTEGLRAFLEKRAPVWKGR